MEKMKAVVYTKYGPPEVLQIQDVDKPVPKDDEVLVEVHAGSLNAYDWRFLRGRPLVMRLMTGIRRPKNPIAGADFAGRVASVGAKVQAFKPGDEVFGCQPGSLAEYASVREDRLALKPASMTFEEAASLPMAGVTALQALRDKGQIQPGLKVLIHGAGGGVGTFAVQIAKSFGADVTAVCGTANVDLVRSLGADRVLDYTREDFAKTGQTYDLILAVNGSRSLFAYRRSLSPCGIYVVAGGSFAQLFQGLLLGPVISRFGRKKMGSMLARIKTRDLDILAALQQSGRIRPVIDRRYPLSDITAAFGYVEQGHARGKVVVTLQSDAV